MAVCFILAAAFWVKQGVPKSRVRSCRAVEEKGCGHRPSSAGPQGPLTPLEVKSRTKSSQTLTSVRLFLSSLAPQTVRLEEFLRDEPREGGRGWERSSADWD